MKVSTSSTLAATVIASVVGTGAWYFGFAEHAWPEHPFLFVFVLTIVVLIVAKWLWPYVIGAK